MPETCSEGRRINYGRPDQYDVRVEMEVAFEPRFHVTGFSSRHWLDECADENGKPLNPRGNDSIRMIEHCPWCWRISATVDEPPDAGHVIGKLKGHFQCKTDAGLQTVAFAFDDLPVPTLTANSNAYWGIEINPREDSMAKTPGQAQFTSAPISLQYANAPVQTILDDFAKQSGLDLGIHEPAIVNFAKSRQASIHLDHADFWPSLRAVCAASGLILDTEKYPGPISFRLPSRKADDDIFNESSQANGPCLIAEHGTCRRHRSKFSLHPGNQHHLDRSGRRRQRPHPCAK
jgi:hypothetical protein